MNRGVWEKIIFHIPPNMYRDFVNKKIIKWERLPGGEMVQSGEVHFEMDRKLLSNPWPITPTNPNCRGLVRLREIEKAKGSKWSAYEYRCKGRYYEEG